MPKAASPTATMDASTQPDNQSRHAHTAGGMRLWYLEVVVELGHLLLVVPQHREGELSLLVEALVRHAAARHMQLRHTARQRRQDKTRPSMSSRSTRNQRVLAADMPPYLYYRSLQGAWSTRPDGMPVNERNLWQKGRRANLSGPMNRSSQPISSISGSTFTNIWPLLDSTGVSS
jgi:hypothetical protein